MKKIKLYFTALILVFASFLPLLAEDKLSVLPIENHGNINDILVDSIRFSLESEIKNRNDLSVTVYMQDIASLKKILGNLSISLMEAIGSKEYSEFTCTNNYRGAYKLFTFNRENLCSHYLCIGRPNR